MQKNENLVKLEYISKQPRDYIGLGRSFPSTDNFIEVDKEVAKQFLSQKTGKDKLWKLVKVTKKEPTIIKGEE